MKQSKQQRQLQLHLLSGYLLQQLDVMNKLLEESKSTDIENDPSRRTKDIAEIVKLMESFRFKLDTETDTVTLNYVDKFTGRLNITNEKSYSVKVCYGIMLFCGDLSCLITKALETYPKKEWPQNDMYQLKVELSIRLNSLFNS